MAAIDDLNAKITALQQEDQAVVNSLTALVQHVESLQAAVAANQAANNDPAISAASANIQAEIDKLTAAVTAAAVPSTP